MGMYVALSFTILLRAESFSRASELPQGKHPGLPSKRRATRCLLPVAYYIERFETWLSKLGGLSVLGSAGLLSLRSLWQ